MFAARLTLAALLAAATVLCATFGTVVPLVGGAADIVLDEARARLYLVNTSQSRVEVYSLARRSFLTPVPTDSMPLSAAMSHDGKYLYVAAYNSSALNMIDLDALGAPTRISLPAKPEGVAVGGDGRVLISTIGTGQGNQANVLLVYDPAAQESRSLSAVPVTPAPPASPVLPAPSGRVFLTSRSQLVASADGNYIMGVNLPNANSRAVFVYEVASGTVLRSRTVTNATSVLSVAPDGSKFMAGLTLFDTDTLQVLAQQNTANSPYPFANGVNFNVQQNQGGSIFSPDGSTLYSAFNIAPVQTPAARANVSQLMLNDPDNLLIRLGLQLPENLAGKMVISRDGGTIYALSDSGFMILPVSAVYQSPIATPESTVSLLTNDQCGAFSNNRNGSVNVRNDGRGRMTATAQLLQTSPTGAGGIGGVGGPGGGAPGGPVIIVLPVPPGGVQVPTPPTLPGGVTTPQNPAVAANSPSIRSVNTGDGSRLDIGFTAAASARNPGTVSPTHTFVVQSNEAINIPPAVRVFQNFRDSESRGEIVNVPVGLSANEALEDMVMDQSRQRIYIANSGLNRIEIYDIRRRTLLPPVKVGQLPRSIAMTPDGSTLYVANSGGESVSIVDLDKLQVTGRVKFPPLPFNSGAAPMTPSIIAAGVRGLQIMMNNGTLWKVVGDEAIPRAASPAIGTSTIPAPRTMAATPGGENIILLAGNGFAYLYDALADEFIQGRQIFTNPIQGYYGPVAAGPRGQYYVVNGTLLNQALTPVSGGVQGQARPVSAVAPGSGNNYLRFTVPLRANANAIPADSGSVEMVDVNSGNPIRSSAALEGPLSTLTGNARVNINGRTMAVDGPGTTAYAITTSGLSIIPLDPVPPAERPVINQGGTVSLSSYVPAFAPGSLVSIFGRNLASAGTMPSVSAPSIMGGICITLNNQPMPLLMTSTGQINAQIPPELAAGRYSMVIRAIDRKTATPAQTITLTKYAPAIFTDVNTKEALIFRTDGQRVSRDNPARRDESLMLFASGVGPTKGGRVVSGNPAPADPLAESADDVQVFFGDPRYKQAEIIVEWAGLAPGIIGVYQINLRVPGDRMKGSELPVTLRIGGVESQKTGPVVPVVAVE